ncbi:hypothetical protein [Desulfosporosinus sp. Sb-LF]|uniref:hypothetical protein n=1 Tax=Desulfosporosinus sp. Sb-LF TaxID=2560027 RepID=UPI00107FCDDD|nr:hypothetical protein [Desulfosporosinus sp. Sb-LF]TGE30960.1 hypothetical protein E4K68_19860 [Desulfosporosinus sp. Sb-LF]
MKSSRIILTLTLVISLGIIAGCGANNTTPTTPSTSTQATKTDQTTSQDTSKQGTSTQTPSVIKTGVAKMLSITADLKTAIDAGDEAKVKVTGPQLEDAWKPFEDDAKQKYPDLYKRVEESLDPTIACSKASPLDKQILGKLNENLTQALNELAAKE